MGAEHSQVARSAGGLTVAAFQSFGLGEDKFESLSQLTHLFPARATECLQNSAKFSEDFTDGGGHRPDLSVLNKLLLCRENAVPI
jgi:hypothetical protein